MAESQRQVPLHTTVTLIGICPQKEVRKDQPSTGRNNHTSQCISMVSLSTVSPRQGFCGVYLEGHMSWVSFWSRSGLSTGTSQKEHPISRGTPRSDYKVY